MNRERKAERTPSEETILEWKKEAANAKIMIHPDFGSIYYGQSNVLSEEDFSVLYVDKDKIKAVDELPKSDSVPLEKKFEGIYCIFDAVTPEGKKISQIIMNTRVPFTSIIMK